MQWHVNLFAILLFLGALLLLGAARIVWKRRTGMSEYAFTGLLLSQAIWLAAYGLQLDSWDLAAAYFWARVTYFGATTLPICFFLFVAAYIDVYPKVFLPRRILYVFLPSIVTLLVLWTNDWHHLFWTAIRLDTTTGPFPFFAPHPGPWFWAFSLYGYVISAWAALILVRAWQGHTPGLYRQHYLILLVLWLLGMISSVLAGLRLWPVPALNPTPYVLGLSSLLIYDLLLRQRFFEVLPLARAAVVEGLRGAVIVLDDQGRLVDLNPAAEGLLGVARDWAVGHSPAELFPAENGLLNLLAVNGEGSREMTITVRGELQCLDVHVSPLRDMLDHYRGRVILVLNITARKQAELLLAQSEQTLQTLINVDQGGVLLTDLRGNVLAFNDSLAEMVNLPREEIHGRQITDLLPPALARDYRARTAQVAISGQPEHWLDSQGGRYTDNTLQPLFDRQGQVDRFAFISHDVTDYKLAELQVRASERILRALIEASTAVVSLCDLQGTLLEFNESLCQLVGLERAVMSNRRIFDLLPAALKERHTAAFHEVIASGQVVRWLEEYHGAYIDCNLHPLLDAEGQISRVAFIARDVTDYKLTELKLRDNEKVTLALLDASTEIAFLMDVSGMLQAFNLNLCALVGLEPYDVRGRNVFDLLPPELAESRAVPLGRVISTGKPQRWIDLHEGRYMDNSVYPVTNAEGVVNRVAYFSRDISDYKQAEAQIRHYADELEARNRDLDAFARTVAHDLKKPLQGIVGYASLIEMDFSTLSPDLKLFIDSILESTGNMVEMIDGLLLLARLRDAHEMAVPVLTTEAARAALRRFDQDLTARGIQLTLDEDMPAVLAYAPWLEEGFANLIGNAIKYIGRSNPAPAISLRAERVGDQVRCAVRDNGLGISTEAQAHLFEQFTRFHHAEASGTGLGLSIVKRIVEKMGGQVGVESQPGEGSTFWFTLPAA